MPASLLWNNIHLRSLLIALWAGLCVSSLIFADDSQATAPKLLLAPQRLRRLQRDRERQTVRWADFENRVQSVPDSPERGFELALYYAVTQDEKRGREAVTWALTHKCNHRQVALILDWCARLISSDEKRSLSSGICQVVIVGQSPPASVFARDALFSAIAGAGELGSNSWQAVLSQLQKGSFADSQFLYATCEYLMVASSVQHVDLRRDAPQFFSELPVELLLSLTPDKVHHPDWMTHVAALALVALDPNLEGSQFLQGWALEDAQMLREGPGVAYELLWADPYLPGVGYENLDPWTYDLNGRLFARSTWDTDACWIAVSSRGVEQENCPAGWQSVATHFGHLTLVPALERCTQVAHRKNNNDVVILWKMRPHQTVTYVIDKRKSTVTADGTGMWRLPENVEGKVCTQP